MGILAIWLWQCQTTVDLRLRFLDALSCEGNTLSGPLNRLNAILSLLQPLDRYRTPSAIVWSAQTRFSKTQFSIFRLFGFLQCFRSMLLLAPNKDSPTKLQSERKPQPAPVAHVMWPNSIRENDGTKTEKTEQKKRKIRNKKRKIRKFRRNKKRKIRNEKTEKTECHISEIT